MYKIGHKCWSLFQTTDNNLCEHSKSSKFYCVFIQILNLHVFILKLLRKVN